MTQIIVENWWWLLPSLAALAMIGFLAARGRLGVGVERSRIHSRADRIARILYGIVAIGLCGNAIQTKQYFELPLSLLALVILFVPLAPLRVPNWARYLAYFGLISIIGMTWQF